jgi:hypothetical protein
VIFSIGEWPLELIFCLLDVLKNDFDEVDEAMIQGVEDPRELILSARTSKKATWTKSLK